MVMRIRLDGDADDPDDADDRTIREWIRNPSDMGGVFVRAAIGSIVATVLSIFGLVAQLLLAADEPLVDEPHLEEPLMGWVWLISQTAAAVSVLGYAVWSMRKQRQLHSQSELSLLRALRPTDRDRDPDAYETQVKNTVFALFLGFILGALPFQIISHALLS